MTSNASLLGAVMVLVVLLAAYGYIVLGGNPVQQQVRMANPASVYCADLGGRVEIREGTGGDRGFCVFPDGRTCEEWELYRTGACAK